MRTSCPLGRHHHVNYNLSGTYSNRFKTRQPVDFLRTFCQASRADAQQQDNPNSSTAPRRRRRNTSRQNNTLKEEHQPFSLLAETKIKTRARHTDSDTEAANTAAGNTAVAAVAADAQTEKLDYDAVSKVDRDQVAASDKTAGSTVLQTVPGASEAGARTVRHPRRKRPMCILPETQQFEPPHIRYDLNSAVGSYSDFNRCSVNLDDDVAGHSNGSGGSSKPVRSPAPMRGTTRASSNGLRHPERSDDDVHGLVYGATVRFSDSAALRLRRRAMVVWDTTGPHKVLIVKKPVPAAATTLREMATWLQKRGLQVFVERVVHEAEFPDLEPFDPQATQVDFAITLGGDGTVLHLASLFAEDTPLPPVMCFAMGTLGFLTPFDAAQFRSCLARVLAANRKPIYCTLRTRKRCAVLDSDGRLKCVHHILNECVVDRGAFPSSVYLELYIDGSFVTAAEADGLIIGTPSGSTAYSMSAGGSMVAPSVPCTLITPLSPHSLSFRPLIIPENADLMIRLPENSRAHARVSFDGKHPMGLGKGCSVHFETSLCPLPLINIGILDVDWYEGITRKLKWNQSIRGVPGSGLEAALLQKAAAAAATAAAAPADAEIHSELQPVAQLNLGGLVSDFVVAAQNEAKVVNWVEEAILQDAGHQ